MLEDMSKEDLIEVIKGLQDDVYHLKMGWRPGTPKPGGYAQPATAPGNQAPEGWALPADRSGQIPSSPLEGWPKNFGKPWLGAVMDYPATITVPPLKGEGLDSSKINACDMDYSPERIRAITACQKRIDDSQEKIKAYQEALAEEEGLHLSGWCMYLTNFEGVKFLYLKDPAGEALSVEIDTRPEINGVPNRPMVLAQFVSALGGKDIPPVWPKWWKVEAQEEGGFRIRHGSSNSYFLKLEQGQELFERFLAYLDSQAPSTDDDGA